MILVSAPFVPHSWGMTRNAEGLRLSARPLGNCVGVHCNAAGTEPQQSLFVKGESRELRTQDPVVERIERRDIRHHYDIRVATAVTLI
jgi:hypothetical protein